MPDLNMPIPIIFGGREPLLAPNLGVAFESEDFEVLFFAVGFIASFPEPPG
jgi:hypothetical protein